ncbi:unnamed protein product, partial [Brassica rapa]
GSPARRAPVLDDSSTTSRIHLNQETISKNLLPHNPLPNLPSLLRHPCPFSLHSAHSRQARLLRPTKLRPFPARLDRAPYLPVQLPHLPLLLLSPLNRRCSLHSRFSLHRQTCLLLFHHHCHAIPKVFKRLMITFLWVALLMFAYNSVFLVFLAILILALYLNSVGLAIIAGVIVSVLYFGVHVYFTALWHLGSVVSVLEPVYGLAAMRKAYELLKGKTRMAMVLVFVYLLLCAVIGGAFGGIVVHGGGKFGTLTRTLVGGLLVGLLVMVNLVGLLVQSVFYYVCKSYHHQTIDKTVLYDHLGGYLGEYVPLKSNIQLENLEF